MSFPFFVFNFNCNPNEELFNGRNDGNDVVDGMQSGK